MPVGIAVARRHGALQKEPMQFASDNWAGASEKVMTAVAEAARRGGPAYGNDPLTKAVEAQFAELFEHDVAVFLVGSGTAANALALSAYARPSGVIFCHRHAHIMVDEAGAAEFFAGARLVGVDGERGKMIPAALSAALARFPADAVHHGRPIAASLTQLTELGAVYSPVQIAEIAGIAHARGAAVHMDGARFAAAAATLNARLADITWRVGVDVLSFGGTKNGCIAAEAVIFFDRGAHAADFAFARQREGQGFSKNWFIAAQLQAYLSDGHWLKLARHANAMGARLAQGIEASKGARLAVRPDANEVFAIISRSTDQRLRAAGAIYYPWSMEGLPIEDADADEVTIRLVTSWQTTPDEVDRFADLVNVR
jgi:threonine aldolase